MIDVKSILRLSREFIKSAEFDKWHFDQLPVFNTHKYGWKSISDERNKYLENYRFINKGSGRFVYEISPTTALKVAKDLDETGLIVFIVCDTGEHYLSKFHSDEWMKENRR